MKFFAALAVAALAVLADASALRLNRARAARDDAVLDAGVDAGLADAAPAAVDAGLADAAPADADAAVDASAPADGADAVDAADADVAVDMEGYKNTACSDKQALAFAHRTACDDKNDKTCTMDITAATKHSLTITCTKSVWEAKVGAADDKKSDDKNAKSPVNKS